MSDKQRFLHDLKVALQRHSPGRVFDIDEAGLQVRFGEGGSLNLHNVYRVWEQRNEQEREQLIRNIVAAPVGREADAPTSFKDASTRLLVRVRDLASRQLFALSLAAEGKQPRVSIERPVGSHLRAVAVIDSDEFMVDVAPGHLKEWECDEETVFVAAGENLTAIAKPFSSPWPGVYVVEHDNYAASSLLLPEATKLVVQGRPLAFAVHRSLLLITGDADEDGLLKVVERVEAEVDQPYPISVRPLVFDGSEWVTHRPAGPRFEALRTRELARLYEQEGKLLQAQSDQVFVATFVVTEEHGGLRSRAVWSEGVPTLLPEADTICFAADPDFDDRPFWSRMWSPKKKWVAVAPFEQVLRVVGHRMERQDGEITRYLVRSFPTRDELEAIGVNEVRAHQPP